MNLSRLGFGLFWFRVVCLNWIFWPAMFFRCRGRDLRVKGDSIYLALFFGVFGVCLDSHVCWFGGRQAFPAVASPPSPGFPTAFARLVNAGGGGVTARSAPTLVVPTILEALMLSSVHPHEGERDFRWHCVFSLRGSPTNGEGKIGG